MEILMFFFLFFFSVFAITNKLHKTFTHIFQLFQNLMTTTLKFHKYMKNVFLLHSVIMLYLVYHGISNSHILETTTPYLLNSNCKWAK